MFSEVQRLRDQRDDLELQLEQARLSKVQIEDPQELQRAKLRIAELERELQGVTQPASNMKLVQKESEIKILKATIENLRQSLRDAPNAPGVEEWVMKYNDVMIEKRNKCGFIERLFTDKILHKFSFCEFLIFFGILPLNVH